MVLKSWARHALLFVLFTPPLSAVDLTKVPIANVSNSSFSAAAPQPSSFTWRSLPNTAFSVGEDLHFVVKWGLVVAGYSNLSVTEIKDVDNRPTYHIVSKAHSGGVVTAFYKVDDDNEAWLDKEALVTVRYEKHLHEGKYQVEETSLLDQVHQKWKTRSFRLDKNTYEEKEGHLTPYATDALGSLYYIRTLPLKVGDSYLLDVHSGDKEYPLVVNVIKRQKVSVPAGKFDCLLVEPFLRGPGIFISKGKKLEVWLTNDARHLPVRMRSEVFIGHVSAELLPNSSTDSN